MRKRSLPVAGRSNTPAPPPTTAQLERDAGAVRPPSVGSARAAVRPGSDLMVQVLRDLGIEYVAANPGSSFEGIQESIINYGKPPNVMPEFITALHEESSVTMAHGYGKATGKPMCALLHGTIGIQHAAMSIYQAYYDKTPALLIAGRDLGFIAAHSANDMAGMVRSYTKWDATPKTIEESLVAIQRAYNEAITPPCGPSDGGDRYRPAEGRGRKHEGAGVSAAADLRASIPVRRGRSRRACSTRRTRASRSAACGRRTACVSRCSSPSWSARQHPPPRRRAQ